MALVLRNRRTQGKTPTIVPPEGDPIAGATPGAQDPSEPLASSVGQGPTTHQRFPLDTKLTQRIESAGALPKERTDMTDPVFGQCKNLFTMSKSPSSTNQTPDDAMRLLTIR